MGIEQNLEVYGVRNDRKRPRHYDIATRAITKITRHPNLADREWDAAYIHLKGVGVKTIRTWAKWLPDDVAMKLGAPMQDDSISFWEWLDAFVESLPEVDEPARRGEVSTNGLAYCGKKPGGAGDVQQVDLFAVAGGVGEAETSG